jgi:hypothetical protein
MRINRGWAVDYGKKRFDVTVEEVDLLRLLADHGAEDPAKTSAGMTVQDVYLVMDAEAMIFVCHSLARQEPAQKAEHKQALDKYTDVRDGVLDRHVPRPAPDETPE